MKKETPPSTPYTRLVFDSPFRFDASTKQVNVWTFFFGGNIIIWKGERCVGVCCRGRRGEREGGEMHTCILPGLGSRLLRAVVFRVFVHTVVFPENDTTRY